MKMINRNLPIPLYFQLVQIFKNQIETGELKPGEALVKEIEITNMYDISRSTARQAITHLVNDGYLRRVKAKGVFVNALPEKPKFVGTLRGFAQEMKQKGIPFSTKVLEKNVIPAPVKIAEKLEIASGSMVFYLNRIRFIHNDPTIISKSYISTSLCPNIEEIDFEKNSLYDILENKYNIFLHHGNRSFEATLSFSENEAKLLNTTLKTPILYMDSITYTSDNIPLEYIELKMRGKFSVDLIHTQI